MNKLFCYIFFYFIQIVFFGYSYEYKLSIIAITKNEEDYLKEWIDYHQMVGVDHFYIYDNNTNNNTVKSLQSYVDAGIVELIPWPNLWPQQKFFDGCQVYAYQNALKRAAYYSDWVAIIDTDEFLVPVKNKKITDVLNNYYLGSGFIYVNWRMFGTSLKYVSPGEPFLFELTKCSSLDHVFNNYGKTICRPELTGNNLNVHFVETLYPYFDGSGNVRKFNEHHSNLLIIHHYVFRDENFFRNVKIQRSAEMWGVDKKQLKMEYEIKNLEYCEEECFRIIELYQQNGS